MKPAKPAPTPINQPPTPVAPLKKADQEMMQRFEQKRKASSTVPQFNVETPKSGSLQISPAGDNVALTRIGLYQAFGTTSDDFVDHMFDKLITAACESNRDKPLTQTQINSVIAAMAGINPQDGVEAMLASQMIATHFAAMRVMRQLKTAENLGQQDSNGNLVAKLMRIFAAQMEALSRYRSKGQQKMTVEHVHVHAGGQAIVGNVTPNGGDAHQKT